MTNLTLKSFGDLYAFARASTASQIGADGLLSLVGNNAPRLARDPTTLAVKGLLIEEAATNLALQSADLATSWTLSGVASFGAAASASPSDPANAYWTKTNLTATTNVVAAPDGTTTGGRLVDTASSGEHKITRTLTGVAANTASKLVFYLKPDTISGVIADLYLDAVNFIRVEANLIDGTVTASNGGTGSNAAVRLTNIKNGWYRVELTGTPSTSTSDLSVAIRLRGPAGTLSYVGDGLGSVLVWGIRVWAGAASVANTVLAGDGGINADHIVETTANSTHYIEQTISGASNAPWVMALRVRAMGSRHVRLDILDASATGNGVSIVLDLTTGTVTPANAGNGTGAAGYVEVVPEGGYRLILSGTPNNANNGSVIIRASILDASKTASYTGDGVSGLIIWGVSAVQSANPLAPSHTPTTTTSVARAADHVQINTIETWLNRASFGLLIEFEYIGVNSGIIAGLGDGNNAGNSLYLMVDGSGNLIWGPNAPEGNLTINHGIITTGRNRIALGISGNRAASSRNGAAVVVDSSANVPGRLTILRLGRAPDADTNYGRMIIRDVRLFSVCPTDAILAVITG